MSQSSDGDDALPQLQRLSGDRVFGRSVSTRDKSNQHEVACNNRDDKRSENKERSHGFRRKLFNLWGWIGHGSIKKVATVHHKDVDVDVDTGDGIKLRRFQYTELQKATNNFNKELIIGGGQKGMVYRGTIYLNGNSESMSMMTVAIKSFNPDNVDPGRSYNREVKAIGQLSHQNINTLVGWCHEANHLLLVYEFMQNGCLYSYLHHSSQKHPLSWEARYNIAFGIAKALQYLQGLVHGAIKPENILLDSNFNPKLTDFEVARYAHDPIMISAVYECEHADPELLETRWLSTKSDIYSFGIVALELVCGIRSHNFMANKSLRSYVSEIFQKREQDSNKDKHNFFLLTLADKRLGSDFEEQQMHHLLQVGLLCTEYSSAKRPSIEKVLQILNMEDHETTRESNKTTISNKSQNMEVGIHSQPPSQFIIGQHAEKSPGNTSIDPCRTSSVTVQELQPYLQTNGRETSSCEENITDSLFRTEQERNGETFVKFDLPQRTFDVGIPSDYKAISHKYEKQHIPLIIGIREGLREMFLSHDPLRFDDVLQFMMGCTSFLVGARAPLDHWNTLAQGLLQAFKAIDNLNSSINKEGVNSEATDSMLSDIRNRREASRCKMEEGRTNLVNLNQEWARAVGELEALKLKIREAEGRCNTIKKQKEDANRDMEEHCRIHQQEVNADAILALSADIFKKISSFSCE